jgi:hypothetical protein
MSKLQDRIQDGGDPGEIIFSKVFPEHGWTKIPYKENRGDLESTFINENFPGNKTKKTVEVKNDKSMCYTGNAFIEIETYVDDKILKGGPYRAKEEGVDYYVHLDSGERTIYISNVTDDFITWLESGKFKVRSTGKDKNREGVGSYGYLVPQPTLSGRADFIFTYDAQLKRTQVK